MPSESPAKFSSSLLLQVDSWKPQRNSGRAFSSCRTPMQAVAVLLLCRSRCFLGSGAGLKVFIHQEWLEKTLLSWWLIWYQKEKDKSRWCFCGGKKASGRINPDRLVCKKTPRKCGTTKNLVLVYCLLARPYVQRKFRLTKFD